MTIAAVRMTGADLVDDRLEIGANLFDGNTAKGVVDPELEDEDVDLFVGAQNGRQTPQSSRGGVAAGTSVDHLELVTRRSHLFRDQRRIRLLAREAVARREAIAERNDRDHVRSIASRGLGGLECDEGQHADEQTNLHEISSTAPLRFRSNSTRVSHLRSRFATISNLPAPHWAHPSLQPFFLMANYGINGFGRIGRNVLRAMEQSDVKRIAAINDLTDTATIAHLLKWDSVHGKFDGEIGHDPENIIVRGHKIRLF